MKLCSTPAIAAKIARGILKKRFPATKFSVRANAYALTLSVSWDDGVMKEHVTQAIEWLEKDFVWENQEYNNSLYITYERNLSPERKAIIHNRLVDEKIDTEWFGEFRSTFLRSAERRLIQEFVLSDGIK
ncbi:hypothetical protein PTI45_03937 [Paenibacillus nuruki]|uniref:Large polyvalent protein associated domain-containing protein n=1 Tax=Paenibacillus nuruki TaxID=1886670 RepID=A0A1E3L172_9BACL|nr:LPD29 domain-containing protein [Paenibacillus nuruki]ODP26700.1 hypothetical protein PTI45_03937 [Paenibacillus nuruki]